MSAPSMSRPCLSLAGRAPRNMSLSANFCSSAAKANNSKSRSFRCRKRIPRCAFPSNPCSGTPVAPLRPQRTRNKPVTKENVMAYQNLLVEKKGAVAIVTLNRPDALNALNKALMDELTLALDDCEADDGIHCIIITGSQKAFAAGADIKEMQPKSYMDVYKEDFITANWERATRCRKPVIAAVAGY